MLKRYQKYGETITYTNNPLLTRA